MKKLAGLLAICIAVMILKGCGGEKRGGRGERGEKGGGGGGTALGTPVNQICASAKSEVALRKDESIVIHADADSDCDVTTSGMENLPASIPKGTTVVRTAGADVTVKIDCGSDEAHKCKYSYQKVAPRRAPHDLDQDDIAKKCNAANRILDLGRGSYDVTVTVEAGSECAVTATGVDAGPDTKTEQGHNNVYKVTFTSSDPESKTVTLSCGSEDKNCKYSYKLERR